MDSHSDPTQLTPTEV